MEQMKRFAVYYAPRPGPFADSTSALLGWDSGAGRPVAQPDLTGLTIPLADLTTDPRKYGFHGTIRAPFRLQPPSTPDDLVATVDALAEQFPPVTFAGLRLENLHGFLALIPQGDSAPLQTLAAAVVRATNPLRAPLSPSEIAKRRPESLTDRQRDLLAEWGYPHVMEEFQFHLTLTNRLQDDQVGPVAATLAAHLAPVVPMPFLIEDLCLFGEDSSGQFHLLHRAPLAG